MSLIRDAFNGVLRKRVFMEGRNLVSETTQPSQEAILRDNAEIRKSPGALRKLDAMQWELQIPQLDFDKLIKCNPGLTDPDGPARARAWKAFIASAESIPYRVRDQKWRA